MIKAHNISFYRLLSTGYISAETFRALMPKQGLYDLSFSDCYQYEGNCRIELKRLFEDDQVISSIEHMEKLEKEIDTSNIGPFIVLDKCLSDYGGIVSHIINTLIGRKAFLLDYVYCTKEMLSSLNYVDEDNYSSFLEFIETYRIAYENYSPNPDGKSDLCVTDLELLDDIKPTTVSDTKIEEPIKSGEGFAAKDIISIDEDALSVSNTECRKYVLFLYTLSKDELNPVIDYLINLLSNFSIRTLNGVRSIGLRNFLVNYLYADTTKLLNIRNFGKKSLFDFDKIRPKLLDYIKKKYANDDTSSVDSVLEQEKQIKLADSRTLKERLGESQYRIITKELEKLSEGLSVRSRNGIINYKGDFIEDFVNKNGNIKSIQHIGRKSESELMDVVKKLKDLISIMKERELSKEEIEIMEKRSFYGEFFDEYALIYYRSQGHLPMFYMVAKVLRKEISKLRNYNIFNQITPFFNDEDYYTYDEVAAQHNLSRESVRQIYHRISKVIRHDVESLNIGKIYSSTVDWQYVKDALKNKCYIDLNYATEIGSDENHGLSDGFVFLVTSVVVKEDFTLIGSNPMRVPSKFKQRWNNSYLVKKHFADVFDFDRIFNIIEDYEDTYTKDSVASAKDMLLDLFYTAWIEFDANVVDELSDIVSIILIQEFGLIPDDNFRFTIEGKKEEDVANVLYDVLSANGNPLTTEELYNIIDSKFPGKYKSPASIRIIVMRDPRMCSVGVNNLVGLLEWDHVMIGSIRDIITQYLSKFDEPQPLSDIADYVRRYRDTSEQSIRSTMISGEQYSQFRGGLFGLKGKKYPSKYYLDENERSFELRLKELESFLQNKKHFPFMPSNSEEESLYRWWNKNKNSTTLKPKQKTEIERIKTVYKLLPNGKKIYEWFDFCHSYSDFVATYGRRPSRHGLNEKGLFAWFEKASHDFSAGDLNAQQEKAYLELCKSL